MYFSGVCLGLMGTFSLLFWREGLGFIVFFKQYRYAEEKGGKRGK